MPYSITTRDGITINGIPDDMPADHPDLRARVQAIRGQSAPAQAAPPVSVPASGVMMGMRDPVDGGAQLLRRAVPEGLAQQIDKLGNWFASKGLPVAPSNGVEGVDSIVKQVNAGYDANRKVNSRTLSDLVTGAEPDPGFDWARLGGNMLNPANYIGGGAVKGASTLGQLAVAGAKAGAASAVLQPVLDTENFWTEKGKQAAGGAAAGAVLTPVVSKVAQGAAGAVGKVRDALAPTARGIDPNQVQIAINNTLRAEGVAPGDVPQVILDSVKQQVEQALQAGAKVDSKAILRKAQFEAVGLKGDAAPTLGQMTRDPMQFANEKNLSGVRIKTPMGEGNPLADRFQLQNQRLGEVFDVIGARDATDRVTAGQTLIDALKAGDKPVRGAVDAAYDTARSMTAGRAAQVDSAAFSKTANEALDKGMWGPFVPAEVNTLLNNVSSGKTPLTVENAVQLDTILSAAQRRAGDGSPQASAIRVIRDALHASPLAQETGVVASAAPGAAARAAANTVDEGVTDVAGRMSRPRAIPRAPGTKVAPDMEIPLPRQGNAVSTSVVPPGSPPVDEGTAARRAFDEARKAARARFTTIEDTPALKAALEDASPDKFVQRYVINADVRDLSALKKAMTDNPEALAQARAQIAAHLKSAAFGENPSGDKAFLSDRYLRTLRAIGPKKLEVFFDPAEIVRLNLAGKVSSDINSIPVGAKYGTNTSGTGAAVMNLLSKLSESPLMRKVPGARAVANQLGEIRTEREISRALLPQPAQPERQLSPEAMRALQTLFAPGGVAGGVLAGMAVN